MEIKLKDGLSPRTLKNKHRALARDLEKTLKQQNVPQNMLERPPTTNKATSSNRSAAARSRCGGAGGKGSRGWGQTRLSK